MLEYKKDVERIKFKLDLFGLELEEQYKNKIIIFS